VKDLTEQIENKWFSLEFVFRELYLLEKHGSNNDSSYRDLVSLQIEQG